MRFFLVTALIWSFASAEEAPPVFQVHSAVFSTSQVFWPTLAALGKNASVAGKSAGVPVEPSAVPGKGPGRKSKKGASRSLATRNDVPLKDGQVHLAVLPIRIKDSDWQETKPCDSCHRLSANGMEFFLENYFKDKLSQRFPKATVELVAPHLPLMETAKIKLMEYQDSLDLPWARWFDGYTQEVLYRPKEWMTPSATRKRLDRLGGLLGATHLLLPAKVWFKLDPVASNVHTGGLEWGFHLVLWNVATGRAEWAQAFTESAKVVDLDAPLDVRLDRTLVATWDNMPGVLTALWKAEPR